MFLCGDVSKQNNLGTFAARFFIKKPLKIIDNGTVMM